MRTGGGPWGGGGGWAWGLKTERYINIYNRNIDMGRLGSFEIGQRLEIFIFRRVRWGDRVGVWGQISGMFILWGGFRRQRLN